jgi:hypothetical protein
MSRTESLRISFRFRAVAILLLTLAAPLGQTVYAQSSCEIANWDGFWAASDNYGLRLQRWYYDNPSCQSECSQSCFNQYLYWTSEYQTCVSECTSSCYTTRESEFFAAQDNLINTMGSMFNCRYEPDFCHYARIRRNECVGQFPQPWPDDYTAEQFAVCINESGINECQ